MSPSIPEITVAFREKSVELAFFDAHLVSHTLLLRFRTSRIDRSIMGTVMPGYHASCYLIHFNTQEFATMRTMLRGVFGLGLVALFASPALRKGGRRLRHGRRRCRDADRQRERSERAEARRHSRSTKAKEFADKNREKMTELARRLQGPRPGRATHEDGRAQQRDERIDHRRPSASSSSPSRSPGSSRSRSRSRGIGRSAIPRSPRS